MLGRFSPRTRRFLIFLYILRVLAGIAGIVFILMMAFRKPRAEELAAENSIAVEVALSPEDEPAGADVEELTEVEEEPEEEPLEEEVVDLGSGEVQGQVPLGRPAETATASTILLPADLQGSRTLGEALDRVPGLDMKQQGGSGQPSTGQIRGSRGQQVLVLVDGQPLSPAETADLALIPASLVESIEILRGPQSTRYGTGAVAGVIDIRLRQPTPPPAFDPEPEPQPICENFSRLLHEAATDPEHETGSIMLRAGSHGLFGGSAAAYRDDSFALFEHQQADNDYSFRRLAGNEAIRHNNDALTDSLWLGQRGETSWRAGFIRQRRGVPGSGEFPSLEARYSSDSALLSVTGQQGSEDWAADLLLRESSFRDPHPYLQGPPIESSDTRLRLGLRYSSDAGQNSWILHPRFDYIDSSGYGEKQRAGLDGSHTWTDASETASSRFSLGLVASEDAGADPVANAGLSWQLSPQASAYVNAGYSVRHPDFDELYLTEQGSLSGNPDLQPERLLSAETGYAFNAKRSRLEAALFYNSYQDSIIFAPVSAYQVKAINTGAAQIAGLELLVDHNLARGCWWRSAYTWLPLAELHSGTPLTGRSSQHLNTRLDCSASAEASESPWGLALEVDYSGSIPADLLGNLRIPPRAIANAELNCRVGEGIATLSVSNILDRQTRDSWNYPLPGRELTLSWRTDL